MRGVFTAGVLQAFMDDGFFADELVGVSAGASNGASYVSRQPGRGFRTNVDYVEDKRYLSLRSFLTTGSLFGMEFIFGEVPERLDPFDYETFYASPVDYYAGATDVLTGWPVFFGKKDIAPGLQALRASCAIPVFSNMVEVQGRRYLDGGLSAPIPFEKALADGCGRLVVILTRPRGYQKPPQNHRLVYHAAYLRYPNLARAIRLRHLTYNHSLARLAQLEEKGVALVVAPPSTMPIDTFGRDREKLILCYEEGLKAGKRALLRL